MELVEDFQYLDYVTVVDLWSDIIAMDLSISTHPLLVIYPDRQEVRTSLRLHCTDPRLRWASI